MEQNKDKQLQYVVDEFERYERYHSKRFEKASKIYDMWIGKPPTRTHDWQNAVHKPLMMEGEQTITPRMFTALFPNDAPIDCKSEGPASPQAARVIKGAVEHYFRVANVQQHFYPALGQSTLFGTGYAESGSWLSRRQWLTNRETGDRYYTIVETRPDIKFVSFFEMFPNPNKIYMWDNLPLIRRRFVDAEYLKSLAENPYFKFDKLSEALNTENPVTSNSIIYSQDGKPIPKKREEYEILDYWGPWDESYTDNNGKEKKRKAVPYWIIIVNRKVKVRAVPNPYNHQLPPFIKIKLFEDVKPSWFGVGIGEIGMSPQERVNKIVNQRLDNVDLVLNKQGLIDGNDTLLNTKQLMISKPGKFHRVQDIDRSVKVFEFNDVTASSYNEEKLASDDFKEATGAVIPLQPGDKSEQHRTAMGIQLLQGAAGIRFKPILRMIELDGIAQTAMFFYSNLHQFMTKPQWIEITGEDGAQAPQAFLLSPEDLQAKVYFIPTGLSETLNKELQIGQLLRFKEITVNDPTVNRMEINRRIAELFGFKNVNKLLVEQPPPQMQPGSLPPEMQQKIRQRMAEGATPDQVKGEMIGPQPRTAITTGGG